MSTTFDIDSTIVDVSVVVPYEVTATASVVLPVVYEAQESVPPTIDNVEILEVGSSSIEISFDVDRQGATECVKGVLWGTTNPPTFNGDYRLQYGDGNIDIDIAGLSRSTTYYLRPYALSNLGYTYGDVVEQATSASPIPNEYQLVEYLQSTGTQYLRILDYFNNDSEINIDFSCDRFVNSAGTGNTFFSAGNNTSYLEIWYTVNETDSTVVYRGGQYHSGMALIGVKCSLNITNSGVQWQYDGYPLMQTYFNNINPNFFASVIYIFSIGRSPDIQYKFNGKLYHVSASLVNSQYDLYPVYRKSDSVAGMYDIVNGVFYTNQGGGTFAVGADKEWEEE